MTQSSSSNVKVRITTATTSVTLPRNHSQKFSQRSPDQHQIPLALHLSHHSITIDIRVVVRVHLYFTPPALQTHNQSTPKHETYVRYMNTADNKDEHADTYLVSDAASQQQNSRRGDHEDACLQGVLSIGALEEENEHEGHAVSRERHQRLREEMQTETLRRIQGRKRIPRHRRAGL